MTIHEIFHFLNKFFVRRLRWVFWKCVLIAFKLIFLFVFGIIPLLIIMGYIFYKIIYYYKKYTPDFKFWENDESFKIDDNLYLIYFFFDGFENNYDVFIDEEFESEDFEIIDDFDEESIIINKNEFRA
jgi:hypothetical protein